MDVNKAADPSPQASPSHGQQAICICGKEIEYRVYENPGTFSPHTNWFHLGTNSHLCQFRTATPTQASPEPRFAPFVDPPHADLLTADDWMHLHVDYDVQGPDRGYIGYIRKDNGQLLSIEDVVQLYGDYVEIFVRESRVTAPVGQPRDDDTVYDLSERIQRKVYDLWNRPSDFGQAQLRVRQAIFDELMAFRAAASREERGRGRKDEGSPSERHGISNPDNAGSTPAVPSSSALASPPQIAQPGHDEKFPYASRGHWDGFMSAVELCLEGIRDAQCTLDDALDSIRLRTAAMMLEAIENACTSAAQPSQVSAEQFLSKYSEKCLTEEDRNPVVWSERKFKRSQVVEMLEEYRAALAATPTQPQREQSLTIRYTNYRGETSDRSIAPARIYFGSTEWHPEEQWLLEAFDFDRKATRTFALKDVQWKAKAPGAEATSTAVEKPVFKRGQRVRVDNPRFHGFGIVQHDTGGPHKRYVSVMIENGNVWAYEYETVQDAEAYGAAE